MSQEITVQATLGVKKGTANGAQLTVSTKPTLTGSNYKQGTQTIPTTAGGTALDVTSLSSPAWYLIINRDSTNSVELLNAASGTVINSALPGEPMMGRFAATVTAPAMLGVGGSVQVEFLIIEP